ncbi:trypsin-like peptidase domain-containing protein [Streptomyces sp. 351MFTsu5.1]|uniref:trypsin-like peptidase domain-containing protein n=1 Tax=Streptomyces sp. 351MFTsu5.1 TaxID=1172180 RepID=UPI00131A0C16|nr:trypsin-like peptidase domain-containing protein [Streptomyces sp. 351MFTsu5.1]
MKIDTPTKELLFVTVRIVNEGAGGVRTVGTGFLLHKKVNDSSSILFIVTNKHVLADAQLLTLGFIARGDDGEPKLGQREDVTIGNPGIAWVGHPDPEVDVAVLSIGEIIEQLGQKIFYRTMPMSQMPVDGDGLFIDAIEEITFIGYPNGQQDPAHLTPIVRRGITATPLELPFSGKPSFLVDGSVFGGSSGSPVFLLNEGFYRSGPTSVAPGNRLVLVGVIAATMQRSTLLPLVVGHGPHVKLAQELNLGVAYNWHAIEQTIQEFGRRNGILGMPS